MLPELQPTDALFLDFDGTLVELAERPGAVIVDAALLQLVTHAQTRLGGALAIVSGRPIADLDRLLEPLRFIAAGEHGAEIRFAPGDRIEHEHDFPADAALEIQELAAQLAGTEAEIKRASASMHFRRAPQHEAAVVKAMRDIESRLAGYALMIGKMVAELKPQHIDKGAAIRELCSTAPFAGRRPVFLGDDVTDEAGFRVVNELGGITVRVGDLNGSAAAYSLDSVPAVHRWLAASAVNNQSI